MLYLSGAIDLPLLSLSRPDVGVMLNPSMRQIPPKDVAWAADNGCFAAGETWEPQPWLDWLEALPTPIGCVFAVCPDVVADAQRTFDRRQFLAEIRERGFRAAYVAQDGITAALLPAWDSFDALFIGGSTDYKLSEDAYALAEQARAEGKWIHMGRVNTWSRMFGAAQQRFDSVDGTLLKFGPNANRPSLIRWLNIVNAPQFRLAYDDSSGHELACAVGV